MSWYREWFDRDEYELVYQQRDEQEAEALIGLLLEHTKPAEAATILDVGCGRGRHARSLARRGYQVTGIDLSARALAKAQELAAAEGLHIDFQQADMRTPVADAAFEGVVNLFTAFGYFDEEADHRRALAAMVAALRPGGWLFQDFLNAPYVAATLVAEDHRQENGIDILQRRWIEGGRINKEITLQKKGRTHTFRESVRLLTLTDFRHLYAAVGLELVATFGDYAGQPHTEASPRLILQARKEGGV